MPRASADAPTTVLSWSGGKDASYALWQLRNAGERVTELLTTVSAATDRSSMHGVRRGLYERQAAAVGLPIRFVELPSDADNDEYEERMAEVTAEYENRGVERIAFADLYLEDVRAYREARFADTDLSGHWPIWGRDTETVAREFAEQFAATVVAVDDDALDASFAGRRFDTDFLADLPDGVDPCGENGEFHTFVHDGPIFDRPVSVETGERVTREVGEETTVHYCDLLAAD
ncbi:adenine nucleotide alpha hydrolase [Halorussus gelatinilyticus]|uniref:Adenine nucleotide alpha hydrolase n=1 Tax=Halorussus gelatinilyticus TaxID=2937524 RepID=A0A8U0ILC0_9EURY|nr:adenine nucleotide alpha hydrolase [Halorussus gelatinilyticus]UPW01933.1 adenine nucleotide alpha hydrolase [Halorussus gelatinilyticus]